jgi:phosphate-selective porin
MKHILIIVLVLGIFSSSSVFGQGCLESTKSDGAQVIGYLQTQYDYHFLKDDTKNVSDSATFRFNRARFGFAGKIPYDFDYYVLFEGSSFFTGNPFLLDAFISYSRLGHWAKVSVGSFKSPISLELNTACSGLHTINRTMFVDEMTTPNRDMGLMVSGGSDTMTIFGMETYNFLKYSVAVTNGTGLGVKDNNMGKNFSGRLVVSPNSLISIGLSYLTGKQKPADVSATKDDEKIRIGVDAEFKYRGLLVQAEYLAGEDKGSYTEGGGCGSEPVVKIGSKNRSGYFLMAKYRTSWELEPVIKYESYDPNTASVSKGDIQNILTLGLNYFFNDWTRLQVNYLYKAEETGLAEYPNDCLSVQLQIKIK